jgi:uncharacterized membrane protein YgcG
VVQRSLDCTYKYYTTHRAQPSHIKLTTAHHLTLYCTHEHRSSRSISTDSWATHRRGAALLAALPPGALLLSHTDLDLNAARYLRLCEGVGRSSSSSISSSSSTSSSSSGSTSSSSSGSSSSSRGVSHLSLQMLPYPWFRQTQTALLRKQGVTLPPNFAGMTNVCNLSLGDHAAVCACL